ncbi:MAG TPA: 23S rRNA (uracil(1939)-C(5))-methyltransferase RlmD [bacterium]
MIIAEKPTHPGPIAGKATPRCRHFGVCGGCRWQNVDYAAQLRIKEAAVADQLRGIMPPAALRPIIPAPDPWYYRNKMEFAFAPPGDLGLHQRGQWRRVVNLEECFLQSETSATIVRDVRRFVSARGLSCYDPRTRAGLLRSLVIREAHASGELMIGLVTTRGEFGDGDALVDMLTGRYPRIVSIVRGITAGTAEINELERLFGRHHIVERVAGLEFKIELTTFFQANTAQAEGMIGLVDEFAALNGSEHVVDLYCGVGMFTLALARRAAQVVGIDAARPSIEAARSNASANGIRNAEFYAAEARALTVIAGAPHPDVLVLDPPRAGAGPRVMGQIGMLKPATVIYVSCNPATLSADVRTLLASGYAVAAAQPIDQFPQTTHVECIMKLSREIAAV